MFESLASMLVIGTLSFWIISAALFFLVLALTENEHNFLAVVFIAAFVALMQWTGSVDFFSTDPISIVKWVGVYFAVGVVWSFAKWYFLLNKKRDQLMEVKREWINKNKLDLAVSDRIPVELFNKFADAVYESGYHPNTKKSYGFRPTTATELLPDLSKYKEKLIGWIFWWPTSAFWTILNDPLVRLAEFIYGKLQALYARMVSNAFSKTGI